jgi:hypothetical protein
MTITWWKGQEEVTACRYGVTVCPDNNSKLESNDLESEHKVKKKILDTDP